jgi:hypothetical protein
MGTSWRRALEGTGIAERHDLIPVDVEAALAALQDFQVLFTTMGRSFNEDRSFFEASIAAGLVAGQLINETRARGEQVG